MPAKDLVGQTVCIIENDGTEWRGTLHSLNCVTAWVVVQDTAFSDRFVPVDDIKSIEAA